ncbi:RluA family pseudouridine synthase [Shouchella sp. JSM 1781072]|uniref:RluA family pseudouridine synthase n=1 Tax=Bacillaceae TaxID=186817 RepID=UPI000C08CCBD|nr:MULTISPECIES: RluA family pseudouridine synthase [Bacillaceae]UTR04836.1 RluA family pseudouridine synthase [Alkalihalobacillus sp. LMS6]
MKQWTIDETQINERIDKMIVLLHGDTSRTHVQKWIQDGLVTVNEQVIKANYKVQQGDVIDVSEPELVSTEVKAENIPLDVVYEDADLIVVNKPRGMVVHPAPGHSSGTLVNALLYHCTDLSGINDEVRPGIVHRIDKDTTGLIVAAKNDHAHEHLSKQLMNKTTKRQYKAIVHGVLSHKKGTIDAPIGRDLKDRQKMAVTDKNSKQAVTHFTLEETFRAFSYVTCELETGRTHQIRVHFQYIEHPLAGDPKYGYKKTLPIAGQALHAETLGFVHPRTNEELLFTAPVPEDMETLLQDLRKQD